MCYASKSRTAVHLLACAVPLLLAACDPEQVVRPSLAGEPTQIDAQGPHIELYSYEQAAQLAEAEMTRLRATGGAEAKRRIEYLRVLLQHLTSSQPSAPKPEGFRATMDYGDYELVWSNRPWAYYYLANPSQSSSMDTGASTNEPAYLSFKFEGLGTGQWGGDANSDEVWR
jgi:hypothetical protein